MRLLVVGGGGREHAIIWKLRQSPRISELYCAPGNAGIASMATCVPLKADDLDGLVAFSLQEKIDRVFVAPDDPLAMGLVDRLEEAGIRAYGPSKAAALIESSKAYAKDLMRRNGIPTAAYKVFQDAGAALAYAASAPLPLVIKADGLALGKGVIIAQTHDEARQAIRDMMQADRFGQAGRTVLLEEYLTGPELTVLAFTDGTTVCPMISSRDHKRALDDDQGPNTGGMGAIAPGAEIDAATWQLMSETIFQPTIDALRAEGRPFKGVIYFGLMLTEQGPKVIEYNARFGDPEAQVVLPLLETDLLDILEAIAEGRLAEQPIHWSKAAACCIVLASGGYPQTYQTGYPIEGLDRVPPGTIVFHAGTARDKNRVVTAGGRVLGVTAVARTTGEAIGCAYAAVKAVSFKDMHYRRDIGKKP